MNKAAEFRARANECGELARGARTPAERQQIERIMKTWESMAEDHEKRANAQLTQR